MKTFKEILIESISPPKLRKILSKNLEGANNIINNLAISLDTYIGRSKKGDKIFVKSNNQKSLFDVLWERLGKPIEDSEQLSDTGLNELKNNFKKLISSIEKEWKREKIEKQDVYIKIK